MDEWDWDLQAVVRGCRGGSTAAAARDPLSSFSQSLPILQEQDGFEFGFQGNEEGQGHGGGMFFFFPNLLGSSTKNSMEELVKLYRPFFPKLSPSSLTSKPPPLQKTQIQQRQSPSSPSAVSLLQTSGFTPEKQEKQRPPVSTQVTPTSTRSKRRKNQQKRRVVCRVPAHGLSSDMWCWRKYGQKPIKGSPFPRGYYRCSSSKGCLARKQVERCRTDPGIFVITYTAEHNHTVPTRRNSLAGSTRHKFPQSNSTSSTTTKDNNNNNQVNCVEIGENIVLPSSNPMSQTTPLTSSMEEEELFHPVKKEGGGVEVEEEEEEEEGMLLVTDMEMLVEDDVVFLGLEDLEQSTPGDHFSSERRSTEGEEERQKDSPAERQS